VLRQEDDPAAIFVGNVLCPLMKLKVELFIK